MILSRILRISSLKSTANIVTRYLTTHPISKTNFSPLLNAWIYQQNDAIKTPVSSIIRKNPIDLPSGMIWVPDLIEPVRIKTEIIAPSTKVSDTPKEAVRMIVIRRKKMKKHKLKKLRKRMKFEWARQRQRREMKKEKEFQAVLIQQCKEAEAFSAENYVEEKLQTLHKVVIPKYWKGKRLPEFIIRQKMGLPPK